MIGRNSLRECYGPCLSENSKVDARPRCSLFYPTESNSPLLILGSFMVCFWMGRELPANLEFVLTDPVPYVFNSQLEGFSVLHNLVLSSALVTGCDGI